MAHDFAEKKPIVLYNDHADFQQTALSGGELIGEGTGGFTEPYRDRVVLPLTANYADTDHVIGHELVHVFQFDIAQSMRPVGQQGAATRAVGLESLPLWMVEGLAEYLSQGRNDTLTSSWMRDAVLRDDLPTLEKMSRDLRYNPYQFGQAVWAYIAGRWGDPKAAELFKASLRFGPEEAFRNVLGLDWKQFGEEWHRDVKAYYQPILAERQKPGEVGSELIGRKAGGRLAVVAGAVARRPLARLPLDPRALRRRPLPCRRAHRQGGAAPGERRPRPARRRAALHRVGGRLVARRPAVRLSGGVAGRQPGARRRRRLRPRARAARPARSGR